MVLGLHLGEYVVAIFKALISLLIKAFFFAYDQSHSTRLQNFILLVHCRIIPNRMILKFLAIVCILVLSFNSNAQSPWPSADSQWYVDYHCMTWNDISRFHVSGTEIISGVECSVMREKTYIQGFTDSYEFEYFIYFNGDTLFWLFEGEFYPLLCFNLEIGDTWNPLPADHPSISNQCVFSPMQVKEKSLIEYNGIEYRRLVIAPEIDYPQEPGEPWPHIYWSGVFDERSYGASYFFPFFDSCDGLTEWLCPEIRCYNDGELSLNYINGAACNPTGVFIEETTSFDNILFFPNPVRSGAIVQTNTDESIKMISAFTLSGQQIENNRRVNNNTLQVNWPSGYYIVECELNDGQKIRSKVMVLP